MADVIPDMVTPEQLAGLPGAPFTPEMVAAAQARIRTQCGWHVAPVIEQTITVSGDGGCEQWLPTRRIVDVTSVQVWDGSGYVDMPGWSDQVGWDPDGILSAPVAFPAGRRTIKVTLRHGFDLSDDLKLLVAVSTGRQIAQEVISSRSITFSDSDQFSSSELLDRYRLGPRP